MIILISIFWLVFATLFLSIIIDETVELFNKIANKKLRITLFVVFLIFFITIGWLIFVTFAIIWLFYQVIKLMIQTFYKDFIVESNVKSIFK